MTISEDVITRGRADWLAARRRGVGGSDVPAILGMSRWDSPRDVWLDKTGRSTTDADSWAIRRGNALEEPLLQWFTETTGIDHYRMALQRNVERPWMIGTPDAGTDDGGIGECKTTGWRLRDEWNDGPADYAELQGQWYCAVTGATHLWVIAAIGDDDPVIERVERDDALIETLIEACGRFWHDYVLTDTEPPVTHLDRDTLAREFPVVKRHRVDGDDRTEYEIGRRANAVTLIKSYQKVKAEAEAALINRLGEADHLVIDGRIAATRKEQTSSVLDMDKIAAALTEHGDDIDKYRVERTSRVLRIASPDRRKEWKD